MLPYLISCYLTLSYPILPCFYCIYFSLSYHILSYHILFYLIFSYHILSCDCASSATSYSHYTFIKLIRLTCNKHKQVAYALTCLYINISMHQHVYALTCLCILFPGLHINDKFGYGALDASQMVQLAQTWSNVGPQHTCFVNSQLMTRYVSQLLKCYYTNKWFHKHKTKIS